MTNPIQDILDNNPLKFKEKISDMLMQKLGDRLETEKAITANRLFGNAENASDDDAEEVEYSETEDESAENTESNEGDDV